LIVALLIAVFVVIGHRKRFGMLEKELDEHIAEVVELQKPEPMAPPSENPQK
jgi:hypothetical protein